VIFNKLLECLLFWLGEGVNLSGECVRGIGFQLDGVVPVPFFWEPLRLFFTEDLAMPLVLFWERWFRNGLVLFR